MSDSAQEQFLCAQCGKAHRWSAARIGQHLLCTCGRGLRVPPLPDGARIDEELIFEEKPAAEQASAPQAIPTARAVNERVLRYRPEVQRPSWREAIAGSEFRHLILPVCFIVVGVAVRFGLVLFGEASGLNQTLIGIGLAVGAMALNVIALFAGVLMVARFAGTDLGPVPVAVLKVVAIALIDSALIGVGVQYEIAGYNGGLIAVHVVLLVNLVLFAMFFEMDLQENLFAVAVAGLLQVGTGCILWHG